MSPKPSVSVGPLCFIPMYRSKTAQPKGFLAPNGGAGSTVQIGARSMADIPVTRGIWIILRCIFHGMMPQRLRGGVGGVCPPKPNGNMRRGVVYPTRNSHGAKPNPTMIKPILAIFGRGVFRPITRGLTAGNPRHPRDHMNPTDTGFIIWRGMSGNGARTFIGSNR